MFTWKPGQFGHNPFVSPSSLKKWKNRNRRLGSWESLSSSSSSYTLPLSSLSSSSPLPFLFFSSSPLPLLFLYSSSTLLLPSLYSSYPLPHSLSFTLPSLLPPPPPPPILFSHYIFILIILAKSEPGLCYWRGWSISTSFQCCWTSLDCCISRTTCEYCLHSGSSSTWLWPHNFIILSVILAVVLGILNVLTLPLTICALTAAVQVSLNLSTTIIVTISTITRLVTIKQQR